MRRVARTPGSPAKRSPLWSARLPRGPSGLVEAVYVGTSRPSPHSLMTLTSRTRTRRPPVHHPATTRGTARSRSPASSRAAMPAKGELVTAWLGFRGGHCKPPGVRDSRLSQRCGGATTRTETRATRYLGPRGPTGTHRVRRSRSPESALVAGRRVAEQGVRRSSAHGTTDCVLGPGYVRWALVGGTGHTSDRTGPRRFVCHEQLHPVISA
jgi:hypothetical protein